MFRTFLKREFLDQLISPKFMIIALLCLVLMPAGMLLNYSSYRTAYHEYESAAAADKNSTNVSRKPSILSTFGVGLEVVLPKNVSFSKFQVEGKGTEAQNEVLGNINGRLDYVVIVSFLLGLFAILYSGTEICAEKESGTLKLVLSNPARRSTVLGAKYVGGFCVLLIPLLISFIIGLLLLQIQGFPLFGNGNFGRILALLGLSVLYLSAVFSLGLFISTLTHRSSLALLAGFFVWIFMTFIIPKISEPMAGLVRPVRSQEVMATGRKKLRDQIEKEKGKALAPLMEKFLPNGGQGKWNWDAYVKARGPVAKDFEERIEQTLQKYDDEYEREKAVSRGLSLNIARLSPASVFTQSALDICHTGVADLENFNRSLRSHYIQLSNILFKYSFQDTFVSEDGKNTRSMGGDSSPGGEIKYPDFRYEFPGAAETFKATAVNIVLLAVINLLFFAAAYYSFVRYDVR